MGPDTRALNPWAAIVGRGQHGKREAAAVVMARLAERGLCVGGSLQIQQGEGEGYDVEDMRTGARTPMLRPTRDEPEVCDYQVVEQGVKAARESALATELDVSIVEVGFLEAKGGGHWGTVVEALRARRRVVLMFVRPAVLTEVALGLPDPMAWLELPASDEEAHSFADFVVEAFNLSGADAP